MSTLRERLLGDLFEAAVVERRYNQTLADLLERAMEYVRNNPPSAALERQGENRDNGYDPDCPTCASHTTPVPCGAHDPRIAILPESGIVTTFHTSPQGER